MVRYKGNISGKYWVSLEGPICLFCMLFTVKGERIASVVWCWFEGINGTCHKGSIRLHKDATPIYRQEFDGNMWYIEK